MSVGLFFGGKMYNLDHTTDEDITALEQKKAPSHLINMVRKGPDGAPLHGIYEDNKLLIRQGFLRGICYFIANREWCNSSGEDKPEIAQAPWGAYPEIPPKFKG